MPDSLQVVAGWILAVLAAERVTEIWHHGKIFAPAKKAIGVWYVRNTGSRVRRFVYEMSTCAWCTSVWVCLAFSATLSGGAFELQAADNCVVKWFALVGISNIWHAMFKIVRNRGRQLCCGGTVYDLTDQERLDMTSPAVEHSEPLSDTPWQPQ